MVGATLLVLVTVLQAEPDFHNPLVARAVAQLHHFEEAQALATLEKARGWKDNTVADLALIEMYAGLARAELSGEKEATASFRIARKLDPTLVCPPGVAPRVLAWWDQAGPPAPAVTVSDVPSAQVPAEQPLTEQPLALTPSMPAVAVPATAAVPWQRPAALAAAGVALASVAVGAVFGIRSRQHVSAWTEATTVGETQSEYAQAVSEARVANISFGVSVAFGLAAVVLWLIAPSAAP